MVLLSFSPTTNILRIHGHLCVFGNLYTHTYVCMLVAQSDPCEHGDSPGKQMEWVAISTQGIFTTQGFTCAPLVYNYWYLSKQNHTCILTKSFFINRLITLLPSSTVKSNFQIWTINNCIVRNFDWLLLMKNHLFIKLLLHVTYQSR